MRFKKEYRYKVDLDTLVDRMSGCEFGAFGIPFSVRIKHGCKYEKRKNIG